MLYNQESSSNVAFLVLCTKPTFHSPSEELVLEKIEKMISILSGEDELKMKYSGNERNEFIKKIKEWKKAEVPNVVLHNPIEEIHKNDLEGFHMRLVLDTIPVAVLEDGDYWLIGPASKDDLDTAIRTML